jgi:hypothetical protein
LEVLTEKQELPGSQLQPDVERWLERAALAASIAEVIDEPS